MSSENEVRVEKTDQEYEADERKNGLFQRHGKHNEMIDF